MPAATTQRASPDALLAIAKKGGRGRLKIFLGAAPGVGKTYAMLSAAHAAKAEGRDVVVGLVETHGRRETEALLAGFELIPRKPVIYVNKILSEFDIDKALARRPELLLLDELAHTNIPGSRHPKRWQDVEELLAAGIDVWTTLNIQHLEGLNDILQRITGVKVRETVPDHVFEDADEIVLVDLPTDELLEASRRRQGLRARHGDRARKRFFKPENLTALRELALRRAAERVDADLVDHMQAQAIEGPWPAGERILACVGPDGDATSIVRAAKRLADVMDAPWMAVTVEGPGEQLSAADRRHVDAAMKLARSLGADDDDVGGQRHRRRAAALFQVRERDADRARPLARRLPRRAVAPLAAARAGAARRRHRGARDHQPAARQGRPGTRRARLRPPSSPSRRCSGRRWPSPAPSASAWC